MAAFNKADLEDLVRSTMKSYTMIPPMTEREFSFDIRGDRHELLGWLVTDRPLSTDKPYLELAVSLLPTVPVDYLESVAPGYTIESEPVLRTFGLHWQRPRAAGVNAFLECRASDYEVLPHLKGFTPNPTALRGELGRVFYYAEKASKARKSKKRPKTYKTP